MILKKKSLIVNISVILLFTILSIVYTYPLILKMHSGFFGDPQWTFDTKAGIYSIWLTRYQWLDKIPFTINPLVSFPFGADLSSVPSQWGLRIPLLILSLWQDEIFSLNVFILSGYVLAAVFVYFLVVHITGSRISGCISGLIYSYAPYHTLKAFSHLGLAAIQWIPLFIFMLIYMEEKRTYSAVIVCAVSFVITMLSSYYYGYICFITAIIFIMVKVILKGYSDIKIYIMLAFTVSILIIPFIFKEVGSALLSDSIDTGYVKPYYDLFRYSAVLSDYFRPSEYHPLFGKLDFWFIKPYSSASRHWAERTLYLGILPLILAVFGAFSKRLRNDKMIKIFFISTACIAFLFSLPPEIKIWKFPVLMPSWFAYKIFPMFRCPVRFGLMVILCIAVMAGLGFKECIDKILSKKRKGIITAVTVGIIMFEFTVIPPFRNVDLSEVPEVYLWMKGLEGNEVIVEYPFLSTMDSLCHDRYLFYQRIHKRKMVNGAPEGSIGDAFRRECMDITKLKTLRLLAYLGAKYIIVHKDGYRKDELDKIRAGGGVKLIKDFEDASVFELTVLPEALPVVFWRNFGSSERWDDGNNWRWLGNNAVIWVGNGKIEKLIDIRFRILAFAEDKDLEIYVNDILYRKSKISVAQNPDLAQDIVIKDVLLNPGENIIRFHCIQGDKRIGDVLNNSDNRRVAFAVSDFRVSELEY